MSRRSFTGGCRRRGGLLMTNHFDSLDGSPIAVPGLHRPRNRRPTGSLYTRRTPDDAANEPKQFFPMAGGAQRRLAGGFFVALKDFLRQESGGVIVPGAPLVPGRSASTGRRIIQQVPDVPRSGCCCFGERYGRQFIFRQIGIRSWRRRCRGRTRRRPRSRRSASATRDAWRAADRAAGRWPSVGRGDRVELPHRGDDFAHLLAGGRIVRIDFEHLQVRPDRLPQFPRRPGSPPAASRLADARHNRPTDRDRPGNSGNAA